MKLRATLLGISLLLVACGDVLPAATTGASIGPSTTAVSPAPTTTTRNDGAIEIRVTATPVQQPDGSIELCPPGINDACPGIRLRGELPDNLLSTEPQGIVIQVTGFYDGEELAPTSDPVAVDYPPTAENDFSSLCPDLRGTPSTNPSPELEAKIGSYVTTAPDYAATWWDRKSSILTVWFAAEDVSAHEKAIAELAGDEPVCVAGGARFSEAELLEASQLLNEIRDSRGLPIATFGYGVGGLSNRIDVPLEELDPETRAAIEAQVGDRVVLYPFIETIDGRLVDLPAPVPAVEGDVEILTSWLRPSGGMDALGQFTLKYDPQSNCVYFGEDTDRTVPVWPFGYSATSDPMIVYDYDGNQVASEGDQLELGGGGVDSEYVDGNTCGASTAWIVNR